MNSSGPVIPQANSLPRLIAIIDELFRHDHDLDSLAETFGLWRRTIAFYIDAARWLGLVDRRELVLTDKGTLFAESVDARSRIFVAGLTRHRVVREIMGAHHAGAKLRDACERVIARATTLAPTTVKRRAGGLSAWLAIALKPSNIDWASGEPAAHVRSGRLNIDGRSFITSLAATTFGSRPALTMAFPRDLASLLDGPESERPELHTSPTFRKLTRGGTHYDGVPLTTGVHELWRTYPREFTKVMVAYSPYICLATLLLWHSFERSRSGYFTLVDDLWGIRFWRGGVPLGTVTEVVETLGKSLGIEVVPSRHADKGDDKLLIELLIKLRIARRRSTRILLSRRFVYFAQREGLSDTQWGKPFAEAIGPARRLVSDWSGLIAEAD